MILLGYFNVPAGNGVTEAATNTAVSASTPAPMQKLKVSGRYLSNEDGTPFFWLCDTAWFIPKISNSDVDLYLADRAAKKFNAVLITCKYHNDVLFNGTGPFTNDNTDLPNQVFWAHIDHIVTQAATNGIYVAMTIMWAEDYQSLIGTDTSKAYRLGKWLGTRYKDNKNVVWVIAGEYDDATGWSKSVYDNVAQGLSDGDLGSHLTTIHPGVSSSRNFQSSSWLDFNMIQSGHWTDNKAHGRAENYELVTSDYALSPTKPTEDSENCYEDLPDGFFSSGNANSPRITANTTRMKAYWAVFAGAFGHTFGNENIEIAYRPGDNNFGATARLWSDALNDPGAGQMQYLRTLIETHSFFNRVPDQSVISSGQGTGLDRIQATRASDGSYALIYIPRGRTIGVDMSKVSTGSSVKASWFNPTNGSTSLIGNYANSGTRSFTPSTSGTGNDWILVLESSSSGPSPTPTSTPTATPTVTPAPTPTPTPSPGNGLTFGADEGNITAPFVSAAGYIYQQSDTQGDIANSGRAVYTFNVLAAGSYGIQMMVDAPNPGQNSFLVNIDGDPTEPAMVWDISVTSGFANRLVSWRGNGTFELNQFTPKIFNLTSGSHQLILLGREANTKVSQISLLKIPQPPTGLQLQ